MAETAIHIDNESGRLYDLFRDNLRPGNYALTKSMEFTKKGDCGTLWYLKKFIVLYNLIFLSGHEIKYNDYIARTSAIFDSYISSLPAGVRAAAEEFFFPSAYSGVINLKSPNFKTFKSLSGNRAFANADEERDWVDRAKKYYFVFLMDLGGQSGVKKHIRDALYTDPDFDLTKLSDLIDSYKAEHPEYRSKTSAIINDYPAALRNERQIMYYYGFFHSKSTGANDREFSSLTPVGELAVRANASELLAIWEMQKLKMISQPPTVSIQNIPAGTDADKFSIGYTPYLNVLRYLSREGRISVDEYKYLVSRISHQFEQTDAFMNLCTGAHGKTAELAATVKAFGRQRDIQEEDGSKELKKYMLGILELPKDNGTNKLAAIAQGAGSVFKVSDSARLLSMTDLYQALCTYKLQRYSDLFDRCEDELRKVYRAGASGIAGAGIDARLKIDWDMYNIRPDNFILLGVSITVASAYSATPINLANVATLAETLGNQCPDICAYIGISSTRKREAAVRRCILAINTSDFSAYITTDTGADDYSAKYLDQSEKDLMQKIIATSQSALAAISGPRQRNIHLVNMMRSLYAARATAAGAPLKCESCGEPTFMTAAGIPYVEFHHMIPFGTNNGPDHYLNLLALCPMCHRKLHHMNVADKRALYTGIDLHNHMNKTIVDRLTELKAQNILKSYHLEFLLADKAITPDQYNAVAG